MRTHSDELSPYTYLIQSVMLSQAIVCLFRVLLIPEFTISFVVTVAYVCFCAYAYKDMHMTNICYWGLLCGITGSIDALSLLDTMEQSSLRAVSTKPPVLYYLKMSVMSSLPFIMFIGSFVAWHLFATERLQRTPESVQERAPLMVVEPPTPPKDFQPFLGRSCRLAQDATMDTII